MNKYENGSVYIGVTGADLEYGEARDSIHRLQMRPGDSGPNFARGTKGYESRSWHVEQFLKGDKDFILMLDADMVFDPDTLERLRSHGLPYVSGLYMRRTWAPIAPIWFEPNPDGEWPYFPWIGPIERGKLHEIGASGWGCILVHRDVFDAVLPMLNGEGAVIEDYMATWPFNLDRVFQALGSGDIETLRQEIRPLIGSKHRVTGSDIRFPYFALKAGFTLYGDPDVRPGHIIHYPLRPDDYDAIQDGTKDEAREKGRKVIEGMREEWRRTVDRLERGE